MFEAGKLGVWVALPVLGIGAIRLLTDATLVDAAASRIPLVAAADRAAELWPIWIAIFVAGAYSHRKYETARKEVLRQKQRLDDLEDELEKAVFHERP